MDLVIQLDRRQQLVVILLAGVILFGAGYRLAQVKGRPADEGRPALEKAGENKAKDVVVHVAGAVAKPGVYQLPQGSRVIDAINKAGPTEEADLDALQLAAPVSDGKTVYVPQKSQATQTGPPAAANKAGTAPAAATAKQNTPSSQLVNINTADQGQLDTLPGIGPALAQRIIQYRESNGPFKTIEELKNVSGIGDKNFENLKDKITVY
ncbi:hypothetical membrane protein [Pelotomaculum thermopropionicum SI]|uniref:Hypothetical membrane protein n=1 Tax=Pelotomaculum thermopropionicum (strain DSM 13744 / JCM 10971 / SI) TaxID=370438 RepID=A5D3Z2_PELTS|nr:hypothetical membrane protein [Pelotomaculum thermopropionicum SI]